MFRHLVLLCALLATGCAAGRTDNCPYRGLIGKSISGDEVETLKAAKDVRLLYPDSYLGFSKKPGRINLIRDENDRVVAVNCG